MPEENQKKQYSIIECSTAFRSPSKEISDEQAGYIFSNTAIEKQGDIIVLVKEMRFWRPSLYEKYHAKLQK